MGKNGFFGNAKRHFGGGEWSDVTVLYGANRAVVRGCRKILSYAPGEIRIARRRQIVAVLGNNLCCTSFAAGSATIEGDITALQLRERGEEKPE